MSRTRKTARGRTGRGGAEARVLSPVGAEAEQLVPSCRAAAEPEAQRDPRFVLIAALYGAPPSAAGIDWRAVAAQAGLDWAEAEVCFRALQDERLVDCVADGRATLTPRGVLAVEWPGLALHAASSDAAPNRAGPTPRTSDVEALCREARDELDPALLVAEVAQRIDELQLTVGP